MRKREGIEPRYKPEIMDADVLTNTEGNTGGAKDQGSQGSIGVRDHSTSPRQSPGTREIPQAPSITGVGRHNRQTGRKPNGSREVGCPNSSEEVG